MNQTDDVRGELLAIRAQCDAALAKLGAPIAPDVPPTPPAEYMTYEEFGQHIHASLATVKRWKKDGMPVAELGRVVRVKVAEAKAWIAAGGAKGAAKHDATMRAARGDVR